MNKPIVKTYNGYEIEVDKKGKFSTTIDGVEVENTLLERLEETIDKFKKKTFRKLKALDITYGYDANEVTVTSVKHDGSSYRPYTARITDQNKSSTQISLYDLIKPTPENIARIKKLKTLKEKSKKLDKQSRDTKDKIEYFKPEDLGFEPEVKDDE